jgi:hypothetical protein
MLRLVPDDPDLLLLLQGVASALEELLQAVAISKIPLLAASTPSNSVPAWAKPG